MKLLSISLFWLFERAPRTLFFWRKRKKAQEDPLTEVERVEEQLWLLALLLIFLLTVGLFLLSAAGDMNVVGGNGDIPVVTPLLNTLGNDVTTSFLLVIVLLICAYFRERLIARRDENRRLVEKLRAANSKLEQKNHQLATWSELSHALIASFDLTSLLDLIVKTAIEVTCAEKASVMLLDDERKQLRVAAAHGLSEEVIVETRIPMGEGIAGWVALHGEPLLLTRRSPDPRLQERLQRDEICSAISVPLRVDSAVVGTLNVSESNREQELSLEELRSLCVFANQAALALEKAHLYHESQIQLEKMLKLLDELQNTQQQLIQSEKLASVGTLAGGVAHEINNPLMVILGRVELLMMSSDLSDAMRSDLEIVRAETRRISDIVRSLLNFSRRSQEDSFEPVDVNEVIERTIALTQHQLKGDSVSVQKQLQADLPKIEANSGQMQQVFTNMVINAWHAMPQGGVIIVRSKKIAGDGITIEFEDSGCGIPKQNLDKIFDPFFTTKEEGKGTGLGLAVSHSIIERHGGDIGVQSEVGKGTIFTIQLPLEGAAARAAQEPEKYLTNGQLLAVAGKAE